jgi:hypothetical protein
MALFSHLLINRFGGPVAVEHRRKKKIAIDGRKMRRFSKN